MKLHRIYGVLLRYTYNFKRSYDSLTDAFYWPLLDLLLWGVTSSYLQKTTGASVNIILVFISGIVFWIIFWRAQYEITIGFMYELWNKNLVNLFVAPLRFSEWITSWIIMSVIKGAVSFLFAWAVALFLYKVNVFVYGIYMLPFIVVLAFSGWWIGFFICGILMRFGVKIQTIAWSVPWIFAPFSAIYYPVNVLPEWGQAIAHALPMSYVFEGMRQVMNTGVLDWNKLYIAMGLNLVYLILSIIFLKTGFNKILNIGVTKIY